MRQRGPTVRVARWSATHPWRALALWLVFVAAAVALSAMVPAQRLSDDDLRVGQSGRAAEIVDRADLGDPPSESVLVTTASGGALARSDGLAAASQLRSEMRGLPQVEVAGAPVWSADGTAVLVPIQLEELENEGDRDVQPLLDATEAVQAAHPDLRIEQAGEASGEAAIWERVGEDLARAERLSLPITFAIMLVAFGALIAAGIPVLLALSAVAAAIGLYAPLSYLTPDGGTVANVVLLIGMAVGVDYSLFYLKREREERRRGLGTVDAVTAAAETSGRAVVVSGFAVMVAMAGLYIAQDPTFASMATGAILVVAVAVLGSLTVLPALLAKLGHWVDRPRVPLLWRVNRRIGPGGISRRLLRPVLAHPRWSLLLAGAVVVGLGVPALGMELKQGNLETLPTSIPEVQTLKRLQAEFPSEGTLHRVVVEAPAEELPAVEAALHDLEVEAVQDGRFHSLPGGSLRTSEDGRAAMLTLAGVDGEGTEGAEDALDVLRSDITPAHLDDLGEAEWAVGGGTAEAVDSAAHQSQKLLWVITFVLGLTMLMMGLTFRSPMIALLTTLLNLASVAAAFGVMTVVFQYSWAESLLDFTSTGYLVSWVPLFLFVVLVGLSMDYHVFVLSRVREAMRRGLSPRTAVNAGVGETAGVVTSAAAVMVSVFAVFATLSMVEMKEMGVGLAVAILVDATLIRVVILPAMLVLLGGTAWWPRGKSASLSDPAANGVEREPARVG